MKTQVKHTMGPWYLDFDTVSTEPRRKGYVLAQVSFGSIDPDEVKANAHLIAAAPELLEACKHAIRILELYAPPDDPVAHKVIDILRTTINKAEGTPCPE